MIVAYDVVAGVAVDDVGAEDTIWSGLIAMTVMHDVTDADVIEVIELDVNDDDDDGSAPMFRTRTYVQKRAHIAPIARFPPPPSKSGCSILSPLASWRNNRGGDGDPAPSFSLKP